ncbi:hypothetical protein B0A54_13392 [Friedmanniomyces endolithicus]|uniref:Uncharacterized protein n=1 Tax=Friedmanniomyces endolithicus TaxID=329885 RepID=A0A4U0UI46_9PEZI|nr:hypothetical protein LTS09_011142 [Friedmanniomyces endolithicus]TKA35313.1 hypothetical protein B0A54_13392 [Friedmanniomyces endolithicus]
MADDALICIKSLLQSIPTWIADMESILADAKAKQEQILFEHQPITQPLDELEYPAEPKHAPSILSSVHTRRTGGLEEETRHDEERGDSQAPLLRKQLPHFTGSDALRMSQRKRKTASVCSGDESGPRKYRSRALVVIYYDGDTQKRLETLVHNIGLGRNAVKRGSAGTTMIRLHRAVPNSGDGTSSSDEEGTSDLSKLEYKSTRPVQGRDGNGLGADLADRIETCLELGQSLCERAAHQVLRDGDCASELSNATKHLNEARDLAEAELPGLEERAQKMKERRGKREERRRSEDVAAKEKGPENKEGSLQSEFAPASPVPSLVSSRPSDGNLEVDLEADDAVSEDEGAFAAEIFQLGKYQVRSTRLMA